MNAPQWNNVRKHPDKAKKMLSALHMSPAYLRVSWGELDEGDQNKVSNWVSKNGSGWFEQAKPTSTPKGIKNVAPEHHRVAVKKSTEGILRKPMKREESVRTVKKEETDKTSLEGMVKEYRRLSDEMKQKHITKREGADADFLMDEQSRLWDGIRDKYLELLEKIPDSGKLLPEGLGVLALAGEATNTAINSSPSEVKLQQLVLERLDKQEVKKEETRQVPKTVPGTTVITDFIDETTAVQYRQWIDDATDIKSIGVILRDLQKSSLSETERHDIEKYAKQKYSELYQAQQRSESDLTLVNEFKSKIEYTEDIDGLNDLAISIVDNVANGNFAKAHVVNKDIMDLHERIDDKITRIYEQKIGYTDDFSQKTPMNLIVISTEVNRLRDLNKKIQASSLSQTRKDNLDIRINSKINEILKLKPKPEVKSLDDFGKPDYASLKAKTDYILIQISEFTTKSQLDAFGSELKKFTDSVGSTDDPKIQEMVDNIVKLYNTKRRLLVGEIQTKIIKTVNEYDIKNLEYEAKNKPPEMLPKKSYEDVSNYTWGLTEQDAINKYVAKERKKLQSNIDYVTKSREELVEMEKTKPHVLLTKAEINKKYPEKAEEYLRDLWNYKSKKSTYLKNADSARFWQSKVEKIDSGEYVKINTNYLREAYIKEVKEAIKKGKPVPYDVIKQYPEFTKSQNSRERYDKGRHTSFANISIAVDTRHQENHGIKIKLQDGTPMEDKYADDIVHLISMYQSVVGNITPVFKQEDVTIAHTKGKHPFLSTAAGCYSPLEKTVTLGRRGVGSHELSHFLDETAKHRHKEEPLYDFRLLAVAKRNMNGGVERAIELSKTKSPDELEEARELRYRLGSYWKRPEELFARLMEQYTAYRTKGQNLTYLHYPYETYVKTPAYWDDETFTSMIPQIEAELNRKRKLAGE